MNRILTTAMIACGLVAAATVEAAAASQAAYCEQVARNAVQAANTHPGVNALAGCAGVGIVANLLSRGNGAATVGGCAVGAGAALVLTDSQRQKIHDTAYYNCMGTGPTVYPAPMGQPVPAGPPPSNSATVYQSLNVRQGPDLTYGIITTIAPNSTISVGPCTPDWCTVYITGGSGWAKRKYMFFN